MAAAQRTPAEREFATAYAPLIVKDHLLRLACEVTNYYKFGATDLPDRLIPMWQTIPALRTHPALSMQHAMLDWNLWLIATAAEMLGAGAADPKLVALSAGEKETLHLLIETGVRFFQSKRTVYPQTRNARGQAVGSASYFNGDLADEERASGYAGAAFPTAARMIGKPDSSWDISHAYRIPVFLWSMYENRDATGIGFPTPEEISLAVNQYVYRVFQGDFSRPLFNNYFDGSNGWVLVGAHGADFGYPPAQYCDAHNPRRPCLTAGAVMGWGLLAPFSPDLARLEHSLSSMALRNDPATVAFRDRYYWYNGVSYALSTQEGHPQYPFLLLQVLSGDPRQLVRNCAP
jgi:hypothetical protein